MSGTVYELEASATSPRYVIALSDPDPADGLTEAVAAGTAAGNGLALSGRISGLPADTTVDLRRSLYLYLNAARRIGQLAPDQLGEILKERILVSTANYYQQVHAPRQAAPFVSGETRVNYAGRGFDEEEMLKLVDSSLEF